MADDHRQRDDGGNKGGTEFRVPPRTYILWMAILGAIVLFKLLTIEADDGDSGSAFAWRPLLGIVGVIIVFGAALTPLGMVVTVPLLIIITGFAGDEFKWKGVLINSAVLTFGAWVIFV